MTTEGANSTDQSEKKKKRKRRKHRKQPTNSNQGSTISPPTHNLHAVCTLNQMCNVWFSAETSEDGVTEDIKEV